MDNDAVGAGLSRVDISSQRFDINISAGISDLFICRLCRDNINSARTRDKIFIICYLLFKILRGIC